MKLKSNRGYVGIDASIAVITMVILISTIMGMVFTINSNKKYAIIKTEAVNIAVNTIESAKEIELTANAAFKESILNKIESIYNSYSNKEPESDVEINASQGEAKIFTRDASYLLKIDVTDYADGKTQNGIKENLVKTVKATVTYKFGKNQENIYLSTVIR